MTIPTHDQEAFEAARSNLLETASPTPATPVVKNFLIVVQTSDRAASLRKEITTADADIFLTRESEAFRRAAYRFVLCEDWDLAPELTAQLQKILINSDDPVQKVLSILERLKRRI